MKYTKNSIMGTLSGENIHVGDVIGDSNTIIQLILTNGEQIRDTLGNLLTPLIQNNKEAIADLRATIKDKEELLEDKRDIISANKVEMIHLKAELNKKEEVLEANKRRFAEILLENNGKDFSGDASLYARAVEAIAKGDEGSALLILSRQKLLEKKQQSDKQREEAAEEWLLRADLLKNDNQWGEELDECYDNAVEIFSSWENCIEAADHFQHSIQIEKASKYYEVSLEKVTSDWERAVTLNKLGTLKQDMWELKEAERNYKKALELYRMLPSKYPEQYLCDIATVLNNLGCLVSDIDKLAAMAYYREVLSIHRGLSYQYPEHYLSDLANTLYNVGNLHMDSEDFLEAESSYKEALSIRRKVAALYVEYDLSATADILRN